MHVRRVWTGSEEWLKLFADELMIFGILLLKFFATVAYDIFFTLSSHLDPLPT
jgi:hypothetical protein